MGRKKSRGKRKQRECTIYVEKIKSGRIDEILQRIKMRYVNEFNYSIKYQEKKQ